MNDTNTTNSIEKHLLDALAGAHSKLNNFYSEGERLTVQETTIKEFARARVAHELLQDLIRTLIKKETPVQATGEQQSVALSMSKVR